MNRNFGRGYEFLEKWLRYSNYNQFIEGVNIIPFKCPLQNRFDTYLSPEQIFNFHHVYDYSVKLNKPITNVIDLTNTSKYYDPKKGGFFPSSIQHHKFMIPGKTVIGEKTLNEIMGLMDYLITNNKVVGIHCTHGVNRTGLIVCTFLVTKLGWDPATAIDAFAKARGSPIAYIEFIETIMALGKPNVISPENSHNLKKEN